MNREQRRKQEKFLRSQAGKLFMQKEARKKRKAEALAREKEKFEEKLVTPYA